MCGIVGATSAEPVSPFLIERMRDRMIHRGPDAAGIWRSQDGQTCLGHRRLAIVDLSEEANQPFVSTDSRFVVVHNGEIYNFRELRRELESTGARFRTTSDTEVLLEAYRAWGEDSLDRLTGMFAFAIWDDHERRLFCARDRAGEKPFHYAVVGNSFVFASELKALLHWPGFRREIDYHALADFFTFGFVADPKTIWLGARKLEAGHRLVVEFDGEAIRVGSPERYWDFTFEPGDEREDWPSRVRDTLARAVDEMSYADVPLGVLLSGGVDSSSVTAALTRAGHRVSTFTIGFAEDEFDERPWARKVANLYETAHTERVVGPAELTAAFPDTILEHYDEPFNDHSYLPTYYVCGTAREQITVALSGDGSDELFAGYPRYGRLAESAVPVSRNGSGPRLLLPLPPPAGGPLISFARTMRRRLRRPTSAGEAVANFVEACFPTADLLAAARGPLAQTLREYRPRDTVAALLRRAPPAEVGVLNAMRYVDLKLTLACGILTKVDRSSMAVSLEVRPVYLHREMLDLGRRIPESLLADGTVTKKLLKQALEPWLPRSVLYRDKMGFTMPLRTWLRGELKELVGSENGNGSSGIDGRVSEFVSPAMVGDLARDHMAGRTEASAILHSVVFLDRWLEKWT